MWVVSPPLSSRESEDLALCRAILPENATGAAFRNPELIPEGFNGGMTTGDAYQVPEPASFRIFFSGVMSEITERRQLLSLPRSFNG